MSDIIAAYATAPGVSGLSVLRIAGPGSADLADRVFSFGPIKKEIKQKRKVTDLEGYRAAFGFVHEVDRPDLAIDQCVLLRFRAPYSYTGEDQVELQIHGGPQVRKSLLEEVLRAGASMAGPGEFTKRAFLNGKMDLTQAESVMDLIQAETALQEKSAIRHMKGETGHYIESLRDRLYQILASLEVDIEYPEYDDFHYEKDAIREGLKTVEEDLTRLVQSKSQGKVLREGLQVVLLGEPNVGKSSLLNSLAREDRAIVTHIAGTTRDAVDIYADIRGLPVQLVDTAGIRESEDLVEQIGVERSLKLRDEADLLILVVDSTRAEDFSYIKDQIEELIGDEDKSFIVLLNKTDQKFESLPEPGDSEWGTVDAWAEELKDIYPGLIEILLYSAKNSWGLDHLEDLIVAFYENLGSTQGGELVVTSLRQGQILEQALDLTGQLLRDFPVLPVDILATGIRQLVEYLGQITGEDVSEQMVEEIFSRFCIGK